MSKESNDVKFILTAKKNGETYNGTTEVQGSISELGAMLFESSVNDETVGTIVLLTAAVLMKSRGKDNLAIELFTEVYPDDELTDFNQEDKTEDYGSFE